VWRGIIDLAKQIAQSEKIENAEELIKKLLDYKKTAEKKTIKIGSGSPDSKIQIMTAHSSKGLEYDYVFIPYSTEEFWLRRPKGSFFVLPREKDSSDEVKDARRLFYVAITRARKHAVIFVPKSDDLGKEYIPLRFVSELDQNSVRKIDLPAFKTVPKTLSLDKISEIRRSELLEYSKRVLSENGLSVTALNHFQNCPSEFLYKSILKVPEAPSPKSEGGIAMHKAISNVWKSGVKTSKEIEDVMVDSIKSYFETSLLSVNEREIVEEELLKNSKAVSLALQDHFNISGKVFNEKWIDFQYEYGSKSISLHGQLDTIIDKDNEVLVFDYKTKEGMSENAIKGLTKNDDGGYWRQLIFYKILLQNNQSYSSKLILPALIFVKPDEKGRCPTVALEIEKSDVDRVLKEVESLIDSVYSGSFLSLVCDNKDCQYCKLKENI
jgi:DNA helicase-2/ATP-dependent DNA helicase PcrA